MNLCARLRDWRRGWSEADLTSARAKYNAAKVGGYIFFTERETKAYIARSLFTPRIDLDIRPLAKLRGWTTDDVH